MAEPAAETAVAAPVAEGAEEDSSPQPLRTATYMCVNELNPDSSGINMVVRVVSSTVVVDKARVDGTSVRIAEVVVADATGCVTLRARDEQVDMLQVGGVFVVRNAMAEVFQNFLRVVVKRWGKIAPHPDGIASTPAAPASANTEQDMSAVEYELVGDRGDGNEAGEGGEEEAGGDDEGEAAMEEEGGEETL